MDTFLVNGLRPLQQDHVGRQHKSILHTTNNLNYLSKLINKTQYKFF